MPTYKKIILSNHDHTNNIDDLKLISNVHNIMI